MPKYVPWWLFCMLFCLLKEQVVNESSIFWKNGIGAREGKDAIKKDIGIEIKEEPEISTSADIFSKLKGRKEQVPVRPIIEGKLE